MFKKIVFATALFVTLTACAKASDTAPSVNETSQKEKMENTAKTPEVRSDSLVEIETSVGKIVVKLFGDTPRHQANFLKLVREGTYNGTLFHRVIDNFMIQAGDPNSKNAPKGQMLGSGDVGYKVEAEILYPRHFHHRGALAAARQGDQVNPTRASSGCQFYIVTGSQVDDAMLEQMAQGQVRNRMQDDFNKMAQEHMADIRRMQAAGDNEGLRKLQTELIEKVEAKYKDAKAEIPEDVKAKYREVGGAPHLDDQYTVFGEVVEGMDVVDKIEKVQTDRNDRPVDDIRIISMKVLKTL